MSESDRVIPVEIHGQRYPIRSTLDPEYVALLATYVDGKMRAASDSAPTGDSLRLAVLAALNIADELFRCRDGARAERVQRNCAERAGELLSVLIDRVLSLNLGTLNLIRSIQSVRVPCFARDDGRLFEPTFHLRESRRRVVCMPL